MGVVQVTMKVVDFILDLLLDNSPPEFITRRKLCRKVLDLFQRPSVYELCDCELRMRWNNVLEQISDQNAKVIRNLWARFNTL